MARVDSCASGRVIHSSRGHCKEAERSDALPNPALTAVPTAARIGAGPAEARLATAVQSTRRRRSSDLIGDATIIAPRAARSTAGGSPVLQQAMLPPEPIRRLLGRAPYAETWHAMRDFTLQRGAETADELWLVEHEPVYTLGQAGRREHLIAPGPIPVVATDRGGQV